MQKDRVTWHDTGTPVSSLYDDPYFSLENGLAEARHVFLAGNDLQSRLRDGFHVAEVGFGTGLNVLATAALWAATGQPGTIRVTSFEAHPMAADDMARALQPWPELAPLQRSLGEQWAAGARDISLPGVALNVVIGDAARTLPPWPGGVDAWFLDGFAPARNPALWSDTLLAQVARKTRRGGTAATYSAAGHVRRALSAAGFEVQRRRGFGHKRHMTVARMPS